MASDSWAPGHSARCPPVNHHWQPGNISGDRSQVASICLTATKNSAIASSLRSQNNPAISAAVGFCLNEPTGTPQIVFVSNGLHIKAAYGLMYCALSTDPGNRTLPAEFGIPLA